MKRRATWAALALGLVPLAAWGAPGDGSIEYNRDIRPILSENCFACHGPDSAARKADLRLDRREAAVEAGVLVPGDPDASALVERIDSDDPTVAMPPKSANKTLTEEQKAVL